MARAPAKPPVTQQLLEQARRHNLGHLLLALSRDFEQRMLARYSAIGHRSIRPIHGSVLRNLELHGTRLTLLAQRAAITHRAVAKIVDDLQQQGYIERRADPADGRATLVVYSRRGKKLLRDSRGVIDEIYTEYAQRVGTNAVLRLEQQLQRTLRKLDITLYRGGQFALAEDAVGSRQSHLSHSLGRFLAEMAQHYHRRCTAIMVRCGHRGIRFDHLAVLSHLDVHGMDHSRLAERAGISLQAMGRQVRAVQHLGYVASVEDSSDRRVRKVVFTARGLRFIIDLLAAFEQISNDYVSALGRRELQSLQRHLEQFIDALDLRIPAPPARAN
jgi:DNA-binding MarR family transcriptional regulator